MASASAFSCEELLSFQIILVWHLVERNQLHSSQISWQQWATLSADLPFFPPVLWCFPPVCGAAAFTPARPPVRWECGVVEDALVQLGSALLVWELNSTKHRLKDKPSQTTNQCWLFFLSEVVPCLGGGRGMASLVSAPVRREERRLQGLLKGKGRRMRHLCRSEEEIKLS